MAIIPIDLPADLGEFVQVAVKRGSFSSANDYIVALVDAARNKRSQIETALLEGLQSGPAEEWTSEEWADIKQRVTQRSRQH